MKKSYDQDRAHKLVPLLTSITSELSERMRSARVLAGRIKSLDESEVATIRDLRAELASQRREIRLAKAELEDLGCIIDDDNPTAVYIPGTDGEHGFRWEQNNPTTIQQLTSDEMDHSVR